MLESVHAQSHFTEGLHVERHGDGSIRARGPVVDGEPDGYWEWFRLDGSRIDKVTTKKA